MTHGEWWNIANLHVHISILKVLSGRKYSLVLDGDFKVMAFVRFVFSAKTLSQANNGMMEQIYTCVWHFDACRPGRTTYFIAW